MDMFCFVVYEIFYKCSIDGRIIIKVDGIYCANVILFVIGC